MVEAVLEDEQEKMEAEYWRTAWQTALLMNATGNYKQRITPERLLGKDFGKKDKKNETKKKSREQQKEELQTLREKFGL